MNHTFPPTAGYPQPAPPIPNKAGSTLRQWAYAGAMTFVGLFSLLILITGIFEDDIGKQVVREAAKQLKTKLVVQEFSLSLLSGFPDASAELKGVFLNDAFGGKLLKAKKVSLRFSLLSLLSSNIRVHSVVVNTGVVSVKTKRNGQNNYDILRAQPPSSPGTKNNVRFSLENASLQSVRLVYLDERVNQKTDLRVEKASFSGDFSSRKFTLESNANLRINEFSSGGNRLLQGKPISYDAELAVDLEKNIYKLKSVSLRLGESPLTLAGAFRLNKKSTDLNLKFGNQDADLQTVLQLLPPRYAAYFRDFKSKGAFDVSGSVKGRLSATENPAIRVGLQMRNARISTPKLEDALEGVSFTASFSNGDGKDSRHSEFVINRFEGNFGKQPVHLNLRVTNFDDPFIDLSLDGALPLATAFGLFNNPAITDGSGLLTLQDMHLSGRFQDMRNPRSLSRILANGRLVLDNAALTVNGEKVQLRGKVDLQGNLLNVPSLEWVGAGSDMTFHGQFGQWVGVLFSDSLNSRGAAIEFNAGLEARQFDLDRLITVFSFPSAKSTGAGNARQANEAGESITGYLNGTFEAHIDEFNYNHIQGQDFSGSLAFKDNELGIDGDINAMNGAFNIDGRMYFEKRPRMVAKVECTNVNITDFFRQCDNFGQQVLVSSNIRGVLTSHMKVNCFWDEAGHFLDNQLQVLADVNINNGELIGFKMLEDFSTFVKVDDLRHVRFTNLRNWLEISHRTIFLPVMYIQSNAMNLTISGRHTFDQHIDYNLMVNAGQVLLNRLRSTASTSAQPAKQKGWFNLYYYLTGTTEHFSAYNSKSRVEREFAASEDRKRDIRAVLAESFTHLFPGTDDVATLPDLQPGDIIKPGAPASTKPLSGKKPSATEDEVEYLPGF